MSAESSIRGQGLLIVKLECLGLDDVCPHERGDSYNIISIQAS